jgi:hypothetical protein
VFRHRFVIVSFVFFFLLVSSVNAFSLCFLENHVPANATGDTPASISCIDNEHPFLVQFYQGHKKISFQKMEKRAINANHPAFLQRGPLVPAVTGASNGIFLSLSIPVYQLKNVYRI